jgi:hypothetical protein
VYVELDADTHTVWRVSSRLTTVRRLRRFYVYLGLSAHISLDAPQWTDLALKDLTGRGFVRIWPKELRLDEGI